MIAAIDETSQEKNGAIFYTIAAAIVPENKAKANEMITGLIDIPGRKNPFHWNTEGVTAQRKMVNCVVELGVAGHIMVCSTGRKKAGICHGVSYE